jgi:hypothetical protein
MPFLTKAILNRSPVSPVLLNPDFSTKLEEIINKTLEKGRKLRYQSAAEIRTDLQRLKRDSDSGRAAVAATEAGSKPVLKSTRWGGGRWRSIAGYWTGSGRLVVFLPQVARTHRQRHYRPR